MDKGPGECCGRRAGPWAGRTAVVVFGLMLVVGCGGGDDEHLSWRLDSDTQDDVLAPARGAGPASVVDASGTWRAQGPAAGAVQAIAAHPTLPGVVLVGAANGGIWKTDDATALEPAWAPKGDGLPSLAIADLQFDASDATRLIAGAGRTSDYRDEASASLGGAPGAVYVSDDGGETWFPRDVVAPGAARPNVSGIARRGDVLLATSDAGALGLFRSVDGGATWTQIADPDPDPVTGPANGLPSGVTTDLVGVPGRPPWFVTAVLDHGVYVSTDMGQSWMDLSGQTPTLQAALAVPAADDCQLAALAGGRIHAVVAAAGVATWQGFIEDDVTWTEMPVPALQARPGQSASPHLAIAAARAGDGVFRANARALAFDAQGDVLQGDAEGIHRLAMSGAAAGTWSTLNGRTLQIAEIHDIAYDGNASILLAGMQGGGAAQQVGTGSETWARLLPGDGGDVAVFELAITARRYFGGRDLAMFQSQVYDAANVLQAGQGSQGPLPAGLAPQPVTPVALSAADERRLVLGAENGVYESADGGLSATMISGVRANASHGDCLAYGTAGLPHVLYVGTGSAVHVRTAADPAPLQATAAAFPGGPVRGIALDPDDGRVAYVCDATAVYRTTDAGASWSDAAQVTGDLAGRAIGEIHCLAYVAAPDGVDGLLAGTDAGVFVSLTNALGTWTPLGQGLPNAPVWDLEYDGSADVLAAGTLGRGAWTLDRLTGVMRPVRIDACPSDFRVEAASAAGATVTYVAPTGSGGTAPVTVTCVPASGAVFPFGPTLVTCTATDALGATDECSFTVTVEDTTDPVITCPPDQTRVSTVPLAVTFPAPAVTDEVTPGIVAVCVPASGSVFPLGPTVVTCTATDGAGNSDTCAFTVTVRGDDPPVDPPVITCPGDRTVEATGPAGAVVSFPAPTFTGGVAPVTVTCVPPSGSVFPLGVTTVTCTATEAPPMSRTDTCTFTVTVADTTKPLVLCPVIQNRVAPGPVAVDYPAPTAFDLVTDEDDLVVACDPASGSVFPLGQTTVTCTATDEAGNVGMCSFVVNVVEPPAFSIDCPDDVTVKAGASGTAVATWPPPTATGGVAPVMVDCDPASGSTFSVGAHAVTCVATDATGAMRTCTFEVIVEGEDPCDDLGACAGALHGAVVETEIFVGALPAAYALTARFLDGFSFDDDEIDRVAVTWSGGFPGAQTGLQDVLTVESVTVSDGVATVRLRVTADASAFPGDAFGAGTKRLDVTINGRRNVGIAAFDAAEVRRGARFSWNGRCGARPPCPQAMIPAATCPAHFEPRFVVMSNVGLDRWNDCLRPPP